MRGLLLAFAFVLSACDGFGTFNSPPKDIHMDPLSNLKLWLAFTCKHEVIPDPSSETDVVFKYARWLQKNNQLKQVDIVDAEIERLYRIAAENDHYKANINLQNGAMRGHFLLRGDEHLRLSQELIDAGVATGYYFVAIALQQGAMGLRQDPEMALRYYRKAADEGHAESQAYVADKLAPIEYAPDVAREMRRCAAEQGHAKAAVMLAIYLGDEGKYVEALGALQRGVAAGYSSAARRLDKGFRNPPPTNKLHYLALPEDLERADRYKKIWKVLSNYSYANPKVPEINDILPLPPAPLPAWDGKLQWLEERLANVAPERPSEALLKQLTDAKQLDPSTGKPLPSSPVYKAVGFPLQTCKSGDSCPKTGYWKVVDTLGSPETIKHIQAGTAMPRAMVKHFTSRIWPLPYKVELLEAPVTWGLLP